MKLQAKFIVVLAVLTAFSACKKTVNEENCTKDAGTFWSQGVSSANDDNKADYNRGLADGGNLTYDDGKAAGLAVAYTTGYNSGYTKGYNEQYPIGYKVGANDPNAKTTGLVKGAQQGTADGQANGAADGKADGYYDGKQKGYTVGYNDGYDDGYYQGQVAAWNDPSVCGGTSGTGAMHTNGIDGTKVKKSDTDTFNNYCKQDGYELTRDATGNYNRGYSDGQTANQSYKKGYADYVNNPDQIALGNKNGYADGQNKGYSDGQTKGFSDTYNSYYGPTYTNYYNLNYTPSYNSAYYYYWNIGYSDGYNSTFYGYDAGYSDGFADGEYDYCKANPNGGGSMPQGFITRITGPGAGASSSSTLRYHTSDAYIKNSVKYKTAPDFKGTAAQAKDKFLTGGAANRLNYPNTSTVSDLHKQLGLVKWNEKVLDRWNMIWLDKITTGHDYKSLRSVNPK